MRGKILFLTGLGVGYVFGTKAGREKYNQISEAASKFWNDPRVKTRVDQVEGFVKEKAPEVAEFVSGNAKNAASKVGGKKNGGSSSDSTKPSGSGTTSTPTPGSSSSTTPSGSTSSS